MSQSVCSVGPCGWRLSLKAVASHAGGLNVIFDRRFLPLVMLFFYHHHRPWKVNSPGIATGTGFHIGNKRILTNNHVVDSGTSIRVRRHGIPGNFEATVLCHSGVCDLALVTVQDDEFWDGIPIAEFQDEVPALDDTVGSRVRLAAVLQQRNISRLQPHPRIPGRGRGLPDARKHGNIDPWSRVQRAPQRSLAWQHERVTTLRSDRRRHQSRYD